MPRPTMPRLHCPACRGERPTPAAANSAHSPTNHSAVSVALNPDGRCPRCAHSWPRVDAWGRTIAVMARDDEPSSTSTDAADHLTPAKDLRRIIALLRHEDRFSEAWLADLSQDDRRWAQSLWTWGPAHFGQSLRPPVAQPDLGWVGALLDPLDDLPDGPVLLLGGALAGESLALPQSWLDQDRALLCLDSHPWLLAGAALVTSPNATLGVLRRPGVLEAREVQLPPADKQRLRRVQLVLGDGHDPPFAAGSFAAIIALSVVDSVRDPWLLMQQCEALLRPAGVLLVSSPWNFQPEITASELQLDCGLPHDGDLPWLIAGRLTGAAIPGVLNGLALQHLERDLPWRLRVHDRLAWDYSVDALLLRRLDDD